MVPLELVQLAQHNRRMEHLVELAVNLATAGGYSGRIDAKVEQRALDGAGTLEREMPVDPQPRGAVERRHQRSVEKDQLGHGRRDVISASTPIFNVVFKRVASSSVKKPLKIVKSERAGNIGPFCRCLPRSQYFSNIPPATSFEGDYAGGPQPDLGSS